MVSLSQRPIRSRLLVGGLMACVALLLSGCSGMIADNMPAAVGGLPADAPARSAPTAYPAVHNMPPGRASAPLSADQQRQLEDDLVAARNRNGGSPDAPSSTGTVANPKAGGARNP